MFIPSESMFAELHDTFDDVLQKGYRAGVIIVSPSLLMLAIQVVQADSKRRPHARGGGQDSTEVGLLIEDVQRLARPRRAICDKHFGQANEDIEQIVTSTDKIVNRGEKIQELEFSEEAPSARHHPRPDPQAGSRRITHERARRKRASVFPRRAGGLPQAARADRAVPRLLLRAAIGIVGRDAVGVDARIRRRSRHHRPVRAGRHALHREIPLGAADRRARRAAAVALARAPPRLAGVHANSADRGDRVPRLDRSGHGARNGRARRLAGGGRLRHPGHRGRRLPGREPAGERAGRRHGLLRRGLSHRHAGLDRRRAVPGQRYSELRLRQAGGLALGLCGDGRCWC